MESLKPPEFWRKSWKIDFNKSSSLDLILNISLKIKEKLFYIFHSVTLGLKNTCKKTEKRKFNKAYLKDDEEIIYFYNYTNDKPSTSIFKVF